MGKVQSQQGNFIQVVGTLDMDARQGEILYVNPASQVAMPDDSGRDPRATLELLSADGKVLLSVHPVLHISTCNGDGGDHVALLQEYIPAQEGASVVRLSVDGQVIDEYSAGGAVPAGNLEMGTESVGTASAHAGPKLKLAGAVQEAKGVTYSIQARPKNGRAWSTLAVGRRTPQVVIDSNQFPGHAQVEVRILRTNGFFDTEVSRAIHTLKKGK